MAICAGASQISPGGRHKFEICVAPSRKRSGMEVKMAAVTINLAGINGIGFGIGTANGADKGDGKDGQLKNGSIFAGNINGGMSSLIEQKRAQARKQATKMLHDQFARDNEVSDNIKKLYARNETIGEELAVLAEQKKGYVEEQKALQEKYGIDPESQEQKDLELLRKANNYLKDGKLSTLSKEELERVAGMGELTEYQKRSLAYDKVIDHITSEETKLKNELMANGSSIRMTKQAILESGGKGIQNAKKAAESILQEASDAIIGMLWEEAKNHVEEEMEKLVEAAKEQAEKKEEEEEKLEAAKEDKEEQKELTEAIQESTAEQSKLQDEIKKIMMEAELLQEDMKGLVVNDVV